MQAAGSRLWSALPVAISVAAAAGIAWRLLRAEPVAPPPDLRCDAPDAPIDCFVFVPGGTVLLGAQAEDPTAPHHDPDAALHEGPVRGVTLTGFWIQRSEAAVGSYRRCVRAGACPEEGVLGGGLGTWYGLDEEDDEARDRLALNQVSFGGAAALCAFLGGRLPTEDEWEHAARAGDDRRWPWGDRPACPVLRRDDDGFDPQAVLDDIACEADGPHAPGAIGTDHPLGLFDVAGNLWEWTADRWHDGEGAATAAHVQRGGAWTSESPAGVRVTSRGAMATDARLPDVGLRCVVGGSG